jgi:cell division protein FtsL
VSPRSAAAAVAETLHAPARTRPRRAAPAPARRRSGAAPAPRTRAAQPRGRAHSRGIAIQRPDALAVLDRVLRGPLYIALVGVLLAGIVFFNVDLLQLNHGIARTDARATQLQRQNAALTKELATLASSERIQSIAIQRGFVLPEPGDVRYLRANPGDADRALRVMTSPDPSSAATAVQGLVSQTSALPTTATSAPAP